MWQNQANSGKKVILGQQMARAKLNFAKGANIWQGIVLIWLRFAPDNFRITSSLISGDISGNCNIWSIHM